MAGLFLKIVSYSCADKYKKDEDDDNDNNGKIHINQVAKIVDKNGHNKDILLLDYKIQQYFYIN